MQRLFVPMSLLTVSMMVAGAVCAVTADDKEKPAAPRNEARSAPPKPAANGGAVAPAAAAEKKSPDEAAIRKLGDAIVQAYQQHNAKSFAAVFTPDGEYVDFKGVLFHGRDEIEKEFAGFFKANPESTVQVAFDAIRPIAPGVDKVEGVIRFQRTPTDPPVAGRCNLVCFVFGNTWQVASLREIEGSGTAVSHHDHVSQLEWLIGEWIHEGPRAEVHFSCKWDRSGNFLVREFSVQAAGRKTIHGTQRIGYDPLSGLLKTWIFDSEGGYSDGYFRQKGDHWVLHTTGVTSEGQLASGTEVFTVDQHRIVWDSVDRIIDGERIPDTGKITIVKKPPAPASASATVPPK